MPIVNQNFIDALKSINLPEEGFKAIENGKDPMGVANKWLEHNAAEAIKNGKDPRAVNDKLATLTTKIQQVDQMAPKTEAQNRGEAVLTGVMGAGKGVYNYLNKAVNTMNQALPTDMASQQGLPQINEQDYQNLPLVQAHPTANAVGEGIGEIGAGLAMANKLTPPGLTAPASGAMTGIAKDAALGAYQTGIMTPGDIESAAQGGVIGGALGAGMNAGKAAIGGMARGITKIPGVEGARTAAQAFTSEAATTIEGYVAKIPFLNKAFKNSAVALKQSTDDFIENVKPNDNLIHGVTQSVLNKVGNTTVDLTNSKKGFTIISTQLRNELGASPQAKNVANVLDDINDGLTKETTFVELWTLRQKLDDDIFNAAGELKTNQFAKDAGIKARRVISNELAKAASKAGMSKQWAITNKLYEQKNAYNKIQDIAHKTLENTKTGRPDVQAFSKQLNDLAEDNLFLKRSSKFQSAIKGYNKLVKASENQAKFLKSGSSGMSVGQLAGTAIGGLGVGAAGYFGVDAGLLISSAIGTTALATILFTTPAGIKILNKAAKVSPDSPAFRKYIIPAISTLISQKEEQQ